MQDSILAELYKEPRMKNTEPKIVQQMGGGIRHVLSEHEWDHPNPYPIYTEDSWFASLGVVKRGLTAPNV